jgi:hypothetical protein
MQIIAARMQPLKVLPEAWTKAEMIAPAQWVNGGYARRVCPLCGREVTEGAVNFRSSNFLSHIDSKSCKARQKAKGERP